MMKVLIVIMMAGMWCMQPEKASAADPVIRVLLTTTDFNSRYHQEITVSYDGKEITYTGFCPYKGSPELRSTTEVLKLFRKQKG